MQYRELVSRLRRLGCEFVRPAGGSREIWRNPSQNRLPVVPHHTREISRKTLHKTLRDLGLTVEHLCGRQCR